jgi:Fe-S cluster assembly protein SufB
VVRAISADKGEPEWMLDYRLKGYQAFLDKPMPDWGVDLSEFHAENFKYYVKPLANQAKSWEDLPDDIRNTYDRLGIPEAEKKRLVSGVAAQYESEVIYNSIREDLKEQGVIFVDTDTAVRDYPELVKKYFTTVIPADDNKFAALNTAAWSGGSFVYVPKGVHVDIPLQAYFRINTPNMGQFERTLIIADEGSYVHYVEGCTAPIYATDSLHAANVEIVVEKGARVRYTTVQNWSTNVYNLVTQRAYVREGAYDGMDRWQHRLQGHDEVPLVHPRRAVCQGGDHVAGLRRRRPVSGYRREDDPSGAAHQLDHRLQVDLPLRRACRLPRTRQDHQGRGRLKLLCGVRRAAG